METENVHPLCGSRAKRCQWLKPGHHPLTCDDSNTGNCSIVNILEAEHSDFHDSNLIAATAAIKEILADIPPDANGRTLSLLQTNMGQLLAWVEHDGTSIEGAVTADSDDEAVIKALNLKL